jgi:hypothetical protein
MSAFDQMDIRNHDCWRCREHGTCFSGLNSSFRGEICIKLTAAPFRLAFKTNPEVVMSEKIKSEMISRRGAFMLLGSAAAFSVAVPVTIMTATDAEARVGNPGSAVSVAGANRRDRRQDRRYKKPPTTTTPTTSGQGEKK